jgi:HlyD family secretion protein
MVLLVLGTAGFGYAYYRIVTRPPELTFRTVKVERGPVVARVTATGTLSAHVTVQVGSQVSGRLAKINVDFNSPVKKGEVIAKIDPDLFEAALASARANAFQAQGQLSVSKAQLMDAETKLRRAKSLRAENLLSQADLDSAATAVEVAKAQIEANKGTYEQARAQEHQAAINLAYTTIVSPIDGTVISRNVDVGQTVAASLQAPTLFTIAEDLRKMQVDTNVTEGDVGKLRDGQRATFMVDAYPNERFVGRILQIRNAAQTVQNVVTYDAVIEVDNSDLKLRPGMTANVTVVYARREAVLRVPNTALRFRPPPSLAASASAALASAKPPASEASNEPAHEVRAPEGSVSVSVDASASGSAAPTETARAQRPRREAGREPWGGGGSGRGRGGASDASPDQRVVWVLRGPTPTPVPVRIGLTDGTLTELVSGEVQEGDAVVVEADTGNDAAGGRGRPASTGMPRMRL